MQYEYLIIPDVHGRDFWKEPVRYTIENTDSRIIFLGDYLDPYEYENISTLKSIENFKEILEIKRINPDRVILLLGNHDLHYVENHRNGCRMDFEHKREIVKMFRDNIDLFELVWFDNINGKDFVFSHAGFTKRWLEYRWKTYTSDLRAECLFDIRSVDWKRMLHLDNSTSRYNILSDVSYHRGGSDPCSSFMWTDLGEMLMQKDYIPNQIFGHTQQENDPVNYNNILYCLDCRKAFVLDNEGVVRYYNGFEELNNNGDNLKFIYEMNEKRMMNYLNFFV